MFEDVPVLVPRKKHVDSLGVLSMFVDVPVPVPRARVEGCMALQETTKKKHVDSLGVS